MTTTTLNDKINPIPPLNHPLNQPKHSVPDAESQRQHDSWSAQWGFFEFPSKNTHCQDAKYNAYDFWDHFIFFLCSLIYGDPVMTYAFT
jgi:hypothetical protein